jgi:hypothetical protein
MSAPKIPDRCRDDVINDILESIALEETAIAHVINAEGEKIQKVVDCNFPNPEKFCDVLAFESNVTELFQKLIDKQNILLQKMKALQYFNKDSDKPNCPKPHDKKPHNQNEY